VGPQINFLVFDGPPQALDKDIIAPRAATIHADGDVGRVQSGAFIRSRSGGPE
jgi:hypothetical protein